MLQLKPRPIKPSLTCSVCDHLREISRISTCASESKMVYRPNRSFCSNSLKRTVSLAPCQNSLLDSHGMKPTHVACEPIPRP